MTEVCAIASGSNGNCYYVGDEKDAILIDAGINCKQILIRMEDLGFDPMKVRAVFITHEHTDHSTGAKVFCARFGIPAYLSHGTYDAIPYSRKPRHYFFVKSHEKVKIGNFEITAFSKHHDALQPYSFMVCDGTSNIGIMTDIGSECENVATYISQCQVLLLESNYDEEMLRNGSYTPQLKQRILGPNGHLSNMQAVELVEKYASPDLRTIMLCHLSGENNTIDKAMEAFKPLSDKYQVLPTSRVEPSAVITF